MRFLVSASLNKQRMVLYLRLQLLAEPVLPYVWAERDVPQPGTAATGTLEAPAQQHLSYSAPQAVLLPALAEGRAQMGLPGRGWAVLAAPAPSCLSCLPPVRLCARKETRQRLLSVH